VNYKAGGRQWVIDSGCTNHITGERKIFSHHDEDISDFDKSLLEMIAREV
jgi:hypothetical protein